VRRASLETASAVQHPVPRAAPERESVVRHSRTPRSACKEIAWSPARGLSVPSGEMPKASPQRCAGHAGMSLVRACGRARTPQTMHERQAWKMGGMMGGMMGGRESEMGALMPREADQLTVFAM